MTEKHVIQSIKYSRSAEFRYCSNLISQISTKKCKASEKRQLFGPYRLMKTIGKGESGKVKLAYSKSGVVAAIKLIKKDAVANASLPTKVMKEVSLMKKLDHPNVVKLIEVIETEWYIGIVMDYVPSGDLFDFICKGKMKEKDAAKLFAQIVSAVFYLHSQGIAHRDLKLENILMDKKQNILLSDFGFATEFQTDRMLKTSCGSPHYAAPEILFDECYDGELAEVWSCGVILYAMVTGYLPFDDDPRNPDGENITLLYEYIRDEEVHFPDHVSADLQDLLRKMLKTDPDERIKMSEIKSHCWLTAVSECYQEKCRPMENKPNKAKFKNKTRRISPGTSIAESIHTLVSSSHESVAGTAKESKDHNDMRCEFQRAKSLI